MQCQLLDTYPRAGALRALGLLLAGGVLTVGWRKTFWRVERVRYQCGSFLDTHVSPAPTHV